MAYSRGRNYRTKGRKSRKRRMKKGRRGKKTGGARLKTQVSSLRRQVKNLIKSPAIKGKELRNHRGIIRRTVQLSTDIDAAQPLVWDPHSTTLHGTGEYCMAAGTNLGRTFPEFKLLPYITSPDAIFPHIMKGQTMDLQSLSLSFTAIWPATYANRKFYTANGRFTPSIGGVTGTVPASSKICPDVEFLLIRYTSTAGKAKLLKYPAIDSADVLYEDQEFEDRHSAQGTMSAVVESNPKRYTYAGVVNGYNPTKAEGFEDCHVVDRKIVNFAQPKWDECIEVSTGNYLVPEVSKRVSLGVSYKKGKKIQLNPVTVTDIARVDSNRVNTGSYNDAVFTEHDVYWSTVAHSDGFIVVARYAGARVTGAVDGTAGFDPIYKPNADYTDAGASPLSNYFNTDGTLVQGNVGLTTATIQWQDCKFSCKYYDE